MPPADIAGVMTVLSSMATPSEWTVIAVQQRPDDHNGHNGYGSKRSQDSNGYIDVWPSRSMGHAVNRQTNDGRVCTVPGLLRLTYDKCSRHMRSFKLHRAAVKDGQTNLSGSLVNHIFGRHLSEFISPTSSEETQRHHRHQHEPYLFVSEALHELPPAGDNSSLQEVRQIGVKRA